jgi:flagellar basal body-associated protein FliL
MELKKKLKFVIPIALLLVLGVAYKTVLAKPAKEHHKIDGMVYVLPKEFLINLADGRYAKLSVGMVLAHDDPGLAPAGGHGGGSTPPDGYGIHPQEAAVRDVITDTLTDSKAGELTDREEREVLKKRVLKKIKAHTDVKVEEILFTDVAVQ